MEPLNNIDVIILVGFAISMFIAFIRGFIKEALSILGLVLFVLLTFYTTPLLLPFANKYIESDFMAKTVIFIALLGVFYTFWIISTDRIINRIRKSTLSFMDRLFGLIFGFIRGVVILAFSFLVAKMVMPEEIEKGGSFYDSKYFMMASSCSDIIEKTLPKDYIQDTLLTVDKLNKPKQSTESIDEETKNSAQEDIMPDDQEQMNKIFELLVNPKINNSESSKDKEETSYNKSETINLDKLIEVLSD